jgi:transposase-like protein
VTRTHALEALVIASFLRGLSVCDVETALEEAFDGPVVSKSTASRICSDTRERYRAWCGRRLDEHDLVYLFLDAIYLKLRPDDEPAEGVLVAWGVTLEGRKVLLGLQLGSRESYEDWLDFGRDLLARGVRPPALIVADGAPGLWKAERELWPAAREQRCTVHALRITAKLAERLHRELKARYWQILDEATSVAEARARLLALAADHRAAYSSAAAVIERDLDALVRHLRFPSAHRNRIRSTNLLERTFVEVRRRTKVIGRFAGETSALSLIWAVLELSSRALRVAPHPRASGHGLDLLSERQARGRVAFHAQLAIGGEGCRDELGRTLCLSVLDEHSPVVGLRVGEPRPGAHALVHGERIFEMAPRLLEAPARRREQAEVARDGAGADLRSVDVQPVERGEPGVEGVGAVDRVDRGGELREQGGCEQPVVVHRQLGELVRRKLSEHAARGLLSVEFQLGEREHAA